MVGNWDTSATESQCWLMLLKFQCARRIRLRHQPAGRHVCRTGKRASRLRAHGESLGESDAVPGVGWVHDMRMRWTRNHIIGGPEEPDETFRSTERTVRDGLAKIHALGVAHGDIAMGNSVAKSSDESKLEATVINFGNND
jgi:hypothetical protein